MGRDGKYAGYELAVKLKAEGFREPVSALWIGDAESHCLDCKEIKTGDYNGGGAGLFSAPETGTAVKWWSGRFGEFSHVPEEPIDCFFEENYS